jgi:hypothetical protein
MPDYFIKLTTDHKPLIGTILGLMHYWMFPEKCFETAAIAVGIMILLDIFTKYVAIANQNDGYRAAVKSKKISSNALWKGTSIKIYSYAIIFLVAGLSYQVTFFKQVSIFLATVIYTVVFLREVQSIVENLNESGADLGWLLMWSRKKEGQILDANSTVAAATTQGTTTIHNDIDVKRERVKDYDKLV